MKTIHLVKEIDQLKKDLFALGDQVVDALDKALKAIQKGDRELSRKIAENDSKIDEKEVEIEEDCLKVLALHQPVAQDLRFIVTTLKVNNDIERIGDLAVNIAQLVPPLCEAKNPVCPYDLAFLGSLVLEMVEASINALSDIDERKSREICLKDTKVDDLHRNNYGIIYRAVQKSLPNSIGFLYFLSVSKYLERIADHATNIAEDVIYLKTGEIARHP